MKQEKFDQMKAWLEARKAKLEWEIREEKKKIFIEELEEKENMDYLFNTLFENRPVNLDYWFPCSAFDREQGKIDTIDQILELLNELEEV